MLCTCNSTPDITIQFINRNTDKVIYELKNNQVEQMDYALGSSTTALIRLYLRAISLDDIKFFATAEMSNYRFRLITDQSWRAIDKSYDDIADDVIYDCDTFGFNYSIDDGDTVWKITLRY